MDTEGLKVINSNAYVNTKANTIKKKK